MFHSQLRHAYRHAHKFLGQAYHETRKYARGFDQFMNAAGRTIMTLQPLLDEVAPQARKNLAQGLEDYDLVRSRVLGGHQTAQRYVAALGRNVPELNLRLL